MNLTEEQIRQGLRNKIKDLERQIELCKTALRAFGEDIKPKSSQLAFDITTEYQSPKPSPERKTVLSRVEGLLKDSQIPMTSKEIMQSLNELYRTEYTMDNFSGNFSQAYRKAGSNVKRFVFPDTSNEFKFAYGLKSWAEGENLKEEYFQKYVEKHLT